MPEAIAILLILPIAGAAVLLLAGDPYEGEPN